MRRIVARAGALTAFVTAFTASTLVAQDRVATLLEVHRLYASVDAARIWPGFRPDTVPVLYVIPDSGTLLAGWRGAAPEGFTSVAGHPGALWRPAAAKGAASTNVQFGGRTAAQVSVQYDQTPAALLATSVHEAFHVFERSVARDDRRFGSGENSFLVTQYPIFDAANEAAFALEGRILRAALVAGTDSAARALVWEFLAVRFARHRRLDPDLAEFDVMAEMNEGLAQYAGTRALSLVKLPEAWRADARAYEARVPHGLDSLITDPSRSLRLRFYFTGPAIAMLLDRLAGAAWKTEVATSYRSLEEELGYVSDYFDREAALERDARAAFGGKGLDSLAANRVSALQALRRATMDSILSAPGLELVVQGDSLGGIGICGLDPQNLLQAGDGVLLHTRWVRLCAGGALQSEFNTPVVQDQHANTLRAIIGAEDSVRLREGDAPFTLSDGARRADVADLHVESPSVTLTAQHVNIERRGRTIIVEPLRR